VVRGDARSFANHRDAARALPCGTSVREREARVVVDQPGCHNQVACHGFRIGLVQAQQVTANRGFEIGGLDVVGQIRLLGSRCTALLRLAAASSARTFATATTIRRRPFTALERPAIRAATITGPAEAGALTRVAALETTALLGIATPIETTAITGVAALTGIAATTGAATITGITTATVEATTLARVTTTIETATITGLGTTIRTTAIA
jgi:hypothetical protein